MSAVRSLSANNLLLARRMLRKSLAEATLLGARFRLSGSDVVHEHVDTLPAPLRGIIEDYIGDGTLRRYLDIGLVDIEAVEFTRKLGVKPCSRAGLLGRSSCCAPAHPGSARAGWNPRDRYRDRTKSWAWCSPSVDPHQQGRRGIRVAASGNRSCRPRPAPRRYSSDSIICRRRALLCV